MVPVAVVAVVAVVAGVVALAAPVENVVTPDAVGSMAAVTKGVVPSAAAPVAPSAWKAFATFKTALLSLEDIARANTARRASFNSCGKSRRSARLRNAVA